MDAHLLTALVTMYAGAGCMDIARQFYMKMSVRSLFVSTPWFLGLQKLGGSMMRDIFDRMEKKDLVCWAAMISAYAESDHPEEALRVFDEIVAMGQSLMRLQWGVLYQLVEPVFWKKRNGFHEYTHRSGFESSLTMGRCEEGKARNGRKNVFKEKGVSRIDLNRESHEFLIGDKRHKQSDEISAKLKEVVSELKLAGCIPDYGSVLVDV
ncbi:hypothetical protein Bca52824_090077 [Brassica carinata]|uniref:Pentatricopeptide repeat-containing protein n=1 Tax=Brassica carinata TaxID=52824 RepID=A0A8X7NV87_BRACI|nr:hypothetical protein Bca52824_090077 [Brassica carinata]